MAHRLFSCGDVGTRLPGRGRVSLAAPRAQAARAATSVAVHRRQPRQNVSDAINDICIDSARAHQASCEVKRRRHAAFSAAATSAAASPADPPAALAVAVSLAVPSVQAARAATLVAVQASVASRPASAVPTTPVRQAPSTPAACASARASGSAQCADAAEPAAKCAAWR